MKPFLPVLLSLALVGCAQSSTPVVTSTSAPVASSQSGQAVAAAFPVQHSDADWRKMLPQESYDVLRHAGTERSFSGAYYNNHEPGQYRCAGCGNLLFRSDTKFESGTGWPSFFQPIDPKAVIQHTDSSFGMSRTEVLCSQCGGHLGHVFEDGPKPTGLRCMNSAALKFEKS
jgi:peptide-methionine (R)-S-oxide reductase